MPPSGFAFPRASRSPWPPRPGVTGSVVAFTFDPNGVPCVSIEQGPIARLIDDDNDGRYDRRQVIETAGAQLPGTLVHPRLAVRCRPWPAGAGHLSAGRCRTRMATFEECELVRGTDGGMGEHGPHAVALGPDGLLYYNNGNHAHLKPPDRPEEPGQHRV